MQLHTVSHCCLLHLQGGLTEVFKGWELLALVLAAAGHDVGHPGKATNPATVLAKQPLNDSKPCMVLSWQVPPVVIRMSTSDACDWTATAFSDCCSSRIWLHIS